MGIKTIVALGLTAIIALSACSNNKSNSKLRHIVTELSDQMNLTSRTAAEIMSYKSMSQDSICNKTYQVLGEWYAYQQEELSHNQSPEKTANLQAAYNHYKEIIDYECSKNDTI